MIKLNQIVIQTLYPRLLLLFILTQQTFTMHPLQTKVNARFEGLVAAMGDCHVRVIATVYCVLSMCQNFT